MKETWYISSVTLGPLGYAPAAGTLGSLVALPVLYIMRLYVHTVLYQFFIIFFLTFFAIALIAHALRDFSEQNFNKKDPSPIIVDEVIGCLWALVGHNFDALTLSLGFVVFRALDIFKPSLIARCELLPGAYGIIADDVLAGILTSGILYFFFKL